MSKIKCFKCKGKGYIRGKIDPLFAVLSFGLTALMDKSDIDKCNACNGTGYLDE